MVVTEDKMKECQFKKRGTSSKKEISSFQNISRLWDPVVKSSTKGDVFLLPARSLRTQANGVYIVFILTSKQPHLISILVVNKH